MEIKNSDTWNLDVTMAEFILPRIVRYRKICDGHPSYMSQEEWWSILDKIIKAMRLIIDNFEHGNCNKNDIKEGCCLLGNHFTELWW